MEQKLHGQTQSSQKIATSSQAKTADSLFSLAKKYEAASNYQQALPLLEKSLKMYQIIGDKVKIGGCLSYLALVQYAFGNYPKAHFFYTEALNAYQKAGAKKEMAGTLNNISVVYEAVGKYPQAIEYLKQAAAVQGEIGDKQTIAIITQNIGGMYSKLKDYTNALKYINKAYSLSEEVNDQRVIAKILIEIGEISREQGDFDKSLKKFNEALAIAEKAKEAPIKIEVLSDLGELFYKQSDFKTALSYYNLCLKNATDIKNLRYISSSQIDIGNVFRRLNRNQEATAKCEDGLKIAEKMKTVSIKKEACECLYKAYQSLQKDKLALLYYQQMQILEDSLQMQETSNKAMNMEFEKQQSTAQLKYQIAIQAKEKQRNVIIASLCVVLLVAGGLWNRLNFVRKSREALKIEKDRSEALLLNILPQEIAEELKATGSVKAKDFGLVSILFTDFQSFTQTAQTMSPQRLVEEINVCFEAFDRISEKYYIEKIKTIGDAYMAAGGMGNANENTPKNAVLAGLEMQAFITQRATENQQAQKPYFEMRLGIHAGPIVAGIVGVKKFQYDIWGDTVNTASRMESNGAVGKVNISEALYELIKDDERFSFEYRGHIDAKGKGEIKMYFVEKNTSVLAS